MALPAAFENATEYIEEAVRFLKDSQLYYNYRNTDILIEDIVDKMKLQDLEKYSVFDKDFNLCQIPEMKSLLDRVNRLKYFHTKLKFEEVESVYFDSVPLGPKKKHEISFLSQEIHEVCQENGCETIIDFGCGLGYLDQLLHKKFNYRILGLESNENIVRGARKRQKLYHRDSKDSVRYAYHNVCESSIATIESLLEEHFPMSTYVCIVGLHACADLTVNAINIFLNMRKAKCLVLMPCCYHKMSLKVPEVLEKEVTSLKSIEAINGANEKKCFEKPNKTNIEDISKAELHGELLQNEDINNVVEDAKSSGGAPKSAMEGKHVVGDAKSSVDANTNAIEGKHLMGDAKSCDDATTSAMEGNNVVGDAKSCADATTSAMEGNNVVGDAKLSGDATTSAIKCQSFCNFPLSETFKLICAKRDGCGYLRIPFLRLAAQPPSVGEDLKVLVFRLLSRAVLQMYCHKCNQRLLKKKRRPVKLKNHTNDFRMYIEYVTVEGYSLECESCTPVGPCSAEKVPKIFSKSCECEAGFDTEELMVMWQHYCTDLSMRKVAILILLQRSLQPMFENLILFDRIVYLKDKGIDNCNFVKVLEEGISPRCLALVASK